MELLQWPVALMHYCILHCAEIIIKIQIFQHITVLFISRLCAPRDSIQTKFIAFKIVNSIRGSALQKLLFSLQSEDLKKKLLLHTNVRWLSWRRFLLRFLKLLDDIRNFLAEKAESYPQLSNKVWLINLSFLADFTAKLI